MRRVYHHYKKWEDFINGMWRNVSEKEAADYLQKAIVFTGDAELYGSFMLRAVKEWPIACEHNLTNPSMNHQAWVGHAACCIAIQCPEHITRLAWHQLSQDQQDRANAKADQAIAAWRAAYAKA